MKKGTFLHNAVAAILISAAAGPGFCQTAVPVIDAEAIRDAAVPVRSIDIADADLSDLSAIKKSIGDARVVVLGEATHSEGTTAQGKARLVRFLHERMGFEVLAWESGMFAAYAANAKLKDARVPLESVRPYISTWGNEEAVQPLFAYTRGTWKAKKPLLMAGIDRERATPAPAYFEEFFRSFFERAPQLALTREEWALVNRFVSRALALQKPKNQLPPEPERNAERSFMVRFAERLRTHRPDLKGKLTERELDFAERFVDQALRGEEFNHTAASDFQKANAMRDRLMADNLVWMLETLYPGKKVIVWAATSHFLRKSTAITNIKEGWKHPGWYAGNLLPGTLSQRIYTIAFTSYGGRYGFTFEDEKIKPRVEEEKDSPVGSFEALAHSLGKPYLFVDLRNRSRGALRGRFVSVALGREANSAEWNDSLDAFFFIDAAEPRRMLK